MLIASEPGAFRYFLVVVDAFSGFVRIRRVQKKSQIAEVLKEILVLEDRLAKRPLAKRLISDNGSEFHSTDLNEFVLKRGIVWDRIPEYSPQFSVNRDGRESRNDPCQDPYNFSACRYVDQDFACIEVAAWQIASFLFGNDISIVKPGSARRSRVVRSSLSLRWSALHTVRGGDLAAVRTQGVTSFLHEGLLIDRVMQVPTSSCSSSGGVAGSLISAQQSRLKGPRFRQATSASRRCRGGSAWESDGEMLVLIECGGFMGGPMQGAGELD
eukprot:768061-Hanusia_phi.AAC.1